MVIITYFDQSVNVITFSVTQSDHITATTVQSLP